MKFPKSLNIILDEYLVFNVTDTGEVIDSQYTPEMGVVKLLSEALGFSYNVYSSAFRKRGRGNFRVGGYQLSEENNARATYPYDVEDVTFATAKPEYKSQTLAFLKPFELSVWIGLFISFIFYTLIYFLLFRKRIPLLSAFFHVCVTFLGQHRDWRPKSLSQRMLILTLSIPITILTLSYGSLLFSSLTVPVRDKGITSFSELYEAIRAGKATAMVDDVSTVGDELAESQSEILKYIGEHALNQTKINDRNFLRVIKPNVAVIASRLYVEGMCMGGHCFISQDSTFTVFLSIIDRTVGGFCCMEQVNTAIHRIWAAGLYQKLDNEDAFREELIFWSRLKKSQKPVQYPVNPLTLSSMSGVFYFLIVGLFLGFMCFLCEIATHRYFCRI